MAVASTLKLISASSLLLMLHGAALAQSDSAVPAGTQTASAPADASSSEPAPLTEDELEILVARIALYPDELIAVITAASLYPLQIVEAARFLDQYAKDSSLQPKDTWDGSIISLLNYPDIVTMMSDDLDWTQSLGNAIAYQQQDVLMAIQQLRDQAVADGVIQSDDKVTVVQQGDNIVIQPTNTETVYVPQYPPQMLYDPGYPPAPIAYYPNPYPNYYYPTATFWAGFVTGAFWGAVIDWNDWGVWGGSYHNNVNIDIGCNNCFNNRDFNGNINWNDVDWKNVDRNKISIDKNQFNKIDKTNFTNDIRRDIEQNPDNNIRNKAADIKKERPTTAPGRAGQTRDVRTSTLEGLKQQPERQRPQARPGGGPGRSQTGPDRPQASADRPKIDARPQAKPAQIDHPIAKPKAGAKVDKRPQAAQALGNPGKSKATKVASKRGNQSGPKKIKKGGGAAGGRRR